MNDGQYWFFEDCQWLPASEMIHDIHTVIHYVFFIPVIKNIGT